MEGWPVRRRGLANIQTADVRRPRCRPRWVVVAVAVRHGDLLLLVIVRDLYDCPYAGSVELHRRGISRNRLAVLQRLGAANYHGPAQGPGRSKKMRAGSK